MNFIKRFFGFADSVPPPEDAAEVEKLVRYWRIRVFITLHLGYCMFYVTRKNLTPALHIFSENLNIDIISLGMITGVFSIVYGTGKIFSGLLADKCSARVLMASGLLLSGVINLFFGFLTSLWALVLFWGLNGLCQATGYPPIAKTLVAWFAPRERAKIWSWWNSSHMIGTFMAGGLVALLLCGKDWHAIFYVPGIIGIISACLIFWALRDSPETIGLPPVEVMTKTLDPHPAQGQTQNRWFIIKKYVLCNRYIWYLCLAMCIIQMVRFGVLDWATKFLYEARGIDKIKVVWLWNFAPLLGLPGGLVAGYLSSRFFEGRCGWVSLGYLLSLAGCIYGYIVGTGAAHLWLTFLLLGSIGFFVDGVCVLLAVLVVRFTVREAVGTVSGFSGGMAYILGTAVGGNFLAVNVVSHYGWNAFYYVCIGCCILSFVLVCLCIKRENESFS